MIKNINNAVVYCRQSVVDKVNSFSVNEQLFIIRDYALQNNYQIKKRFFDIADNQNTFTRIGVRKMLDYVFDNYNKIRFIIITDISRLSIHTPEIKSLKDYFKSKQIKILIVNPKQAPKHTK